MVLGRILFCGLLGLVACGKSSEDPAFGGDSGTSGGSGGMDGSGTGGASGSVGSEGAGAGGSGGSGIGGSSGSDGGPDSASTGGSAGSGGTLGSSGRAGSSGAGGSGGSAGSLGSAGTDAGTTTPRCDPLCAAFIAAACSSGPTLAGCLLTCKALTSSATCNGQANAYFDCAEATTMQCTAAGEPVATGCGAQYLRAIGCAVTENPNPNVVVPCSNYCDKVVAAGCPNNAPRAECNTNCLWAGATGTGCNDEWEAYLTCANATSFICLAGFAVAQGCGQAFTAYGRCINAAGS